MSGGARWSDRAAGVTLGGAAGDALGAGYEFGRPPGPEEEVIPKGGGLGRWDPGEWTDDTQMASAVLAPLRAGTDRDQVVEAVATGFLTWFETVPPDVGVHTRAVLHRAHRDPTRLREVAAAVQAESPKSAGNGSLMRTGPAALASADSRESLAELVTAVSDLTHPNPDCAAACVLWCDAIRRFRRLPAGPPESWIDHVRPGLDLLGVDQRTHWTDLLASVEESEPESFARDNGWVVAAFQQALAALEATPVPDGPWGPWHLRRALERAVRGGNDTDTVAAIAGALAGAAWGATAVPLTWQVILHGTGVADGTVRPMTGADLAWSARLAAAGGRPDGNGWPGPSMLDHYEKDFSADPMDVRIDDHLAVGNVHALRQVDADLVLSLCRMGTDDAPEGATLVEVGLIDSPHPNDNPNLVPLLADIARVVDDAANHGRRVFVHCVRAEHRTPAALAAVLVRRGTAPDEAVRTANASTGGVIPAVFEDALTELARAREAGIDW